MTSDSLRSGTLGADIEIKKFNITGTRDVITKTVDVLRTNEPLSNYIKFI